MTLDVEVRVPNTALFRGEGAAIARDELRSAMEWAVSDLRSAIVPATPVGVSGALRAATQTSLSGDLATLTGRVFNPLGYAAPVEHGRRPGSFPPVAPLVLWVQRKLGVAADDARSVAFLVARKIAHRGIKAVRMFSAAHASRAGAIRARFDRVAADLARRLG